MTTPEDKVTLLRTRAELVARLAAKAPLSAEVRARLQGELSILNAKIKALNTAEAAQLKAAADRRKIAGLTEAQENAKRARARLVGAGESPDIGEDDEAEADPAQAAAIDDWILAVLKRGGVKVRRASDGNLDIFDAPAKWVGIFDALCAGLHAAARGEELPEITAAPKARKQ